MNLREALPYARYADVEITFPATAHADCILRHELLPPQPHDVRWEVIGLKLASVPAAGPYIYEDISATRREWGRDYIVLRSNIASLQVTIRLSLERV